MVAATVVSMSFVPVTGRAVFRPAQPPRDSAVEFVDSRRSVSLPMRAALPVLKKAYAASDLHPSVALVASAAHLGLRFVAAGQLEPDGGSWAVRYTPEDEERVRLLAASRAYGDVDGEAAELLVREIVAAVADAVPTSAPKASGSGAFRESLQTRLARYRSDEGPVTAKLPSLVRLSFRVEAPEEDLLAGSLTLVPQVHDEADPLHVADAARLWDEEDDHGFGPRARTHAQVALRGAAEAWPVLDRLLDLPVPSSVTLSTDEVVGLLEDGVEWLKERGVDVLWPRSLSRDLTTSVAVDRAPSSSTAAREDLMRESPLGEKGLFAFQWQLALGGEPLDAAEMDALASAAGPVLRLRGAWAVVHPSVLRRARKRLLKRITGVEALAVALTGQVPEEITQAAPGEKVIIGASIARLRDEVIAATSGAAVEVPAGLQATLRGYQVEGLTWLAGITSLGLGGCLADDMGLGKTLMTIALHLHRQGVSTGSGPLRSDPGGNPTLVVCPASLLGNWEAEIARFAPEVEVRRHHGAARDLDDATGVVLTTYGTMRRDVELLSAVSWGLVVADEAQHVKNAASATAKALREIPSHARVALTGTPVENNLTELWALLDWCVPGLLGSRLAFRRAWASQIEAGADVGKAKEFAALVGPFMLRRRKSDPGVAPELPPKTETDHLLALTREQTVLYEAYVRDAMARIERLDAEDPQRRGLVLSLLTGLKQICNHPAQFLKQEGGRIAGRSQKIDLLDELVSTVLAEEGAVLIFTQYVAMARLLETHWAAAGVRHQFLHGGTPVAERSRMVTRFQDGEVPVFLLSLKAGGVGLNLTRADHVIHVDRWWNPAVEDQATDRAHRIGQTRTVQVHRLITQGTVEERVAELLQRKRVLAEAVLGGGEAAFTELSNAELRELVKLGPQKRQKRRRIAS
ncbi:helicase [Nocardioides albus]|nr:helicase [Nocardioides albus]